MGENGPLGFGSSEGGSQSSSPKSSRGSLSSDLALKGLFGDTDSNHDEEKAAETDAGYSSPESPQQDDEGGKFFLSWEKTLEILGRDHPLLRPFQEAKLKQLLQRKDFLLLEIRQMEQQKVDFEKTSANLGGQLYKVQEEVTRSQVKLDQVKSEREAIKVLSKTIQENLLSAENQDEHLSKDVSDLRERERALLREVSEADQKLAFVKFLKSKCEGEVSCVRSSLSGLLWDKMTLDKNKDVQEFHFERLEASLRREKNTLDILRQATQRCLQESYELSEAAWEQQQELQAVERESKAVEKAWEQNVLLMEKRSRKFADSVRFLDSLQTQEAGMKKEPKVVQMPKREMDSVYTGDYTFQLLNTEKAVKNSQFQHEQLSNRLLCLENFILRKREHFMNAQEELVVATEDKNKLETQVENLETHLKEGSKELEREKDSLDTAYRHLDRATKQQRHLEDQLFEKLHQQTTASKSSGNLKLKIRTLKTDCRELEDQMMSEEQKTAREALLVSNIKNDLQTEGVSRDKARESVQLSQKEAEKLESYFRRLNEKLKSNHNVIHQLKGYLQKLIDINMGHEEPPLQREERAIQLDLKETVKQRLQLQQEALHLQKDVVVAKRVIQSVKFKEHGLRKENELLKDRVFRLSSEANVQEGLLGKAKKTRARLEEAIRDVDSNLHKEKMNNEKENHRSSVSEMELTAAVKELEEEGRKEERSLDTLRTSLEKAEEALAKTEKERNQWEEKLQLAREAQREYMKEKGAKGEMEAMKREINRMNVRWRALEATQRDLSSQMVRSVDNEDALKSRASAALDQLSRAPHSIQATREMQMDSVRRKIHKCQKVLSDLKQKTESTQHEKAALKESLQVKELQYANSVRMLHETANSLQEKLTTKYEDQIVLQEDRLRLRYLSALRENRYRSLAADNENAQYSVSCSLEKRVQAYKNVLAHLLAAYPRLHRTLSTAKNLLDSKYQHDL